MLTLCAHCHGLVHDGFLRVARDANTALRLLDRAGRPLHGRLPAPDAITLAACAVAHAAPESARAGRLRSEADIPTVVDGAWWRAHEHELVWTASGIRVRREGERRAS